MKYSIEEIYKTVGREDKTAGLTFRHGSDSFNEFGAFITVVFEYTQQEREELDAIVETESNTSGYVKAKYLGTDLGDEQIQKIKQEGINSEDIIEILNFLSPSENTFHSKEKRTIRKIEIPVRQLPRGGDLDWMYGFKKKLVQDGIGLCPRERNFYLAAKYYYEPGELSEEELSEISIDGELKEDIEWEYLGMKYIREDISDEEKIRAAQLLGLRKRRWINILDKYLQQAGSGLKKLSQENIEQAAELYEKVVRFKDRRLNVLGAVPIYIDIDSYLHIYMRHVEELQVNEHFEHKDNFQWNEEDVLVVMENIIREFNEEIQAHFKEHPDKWYRKYGPQSAYFEGDYYTFHIEPGGRVSTFHKNKKE